MAHPRHPLRVARPVLALLVASLTVTACLEMVRRPEPRGAASSAGEAAVDGRTGRVANRPDGTAGPMAGEATARSDADRERVRLVNEYVHWCLEHNLWDEARIHLEHALAADSLAASLHNNLAIVDEKQGRPGQAMARYERAIALHPKKAYEENLRLLRQRLEEAETSTVPDSLELEHEDASADEAPPNRGAAADSTAANQMPR